MRRSHERADVSRGTIALAVSALLLVVGYRLRRPERAREWVAVAANAAALSAQFFGARGILPGPTLASEPALRNGGAVQLVVGLFLAGKPSRGDGAAPSNIARDRSSSSSGRTRGLSAIAARESRQRPAPARRCTDAGRGRWCDDGTIRTRAGPDVRRAGPNVRRGSTIRTGRSRGRHSGRPLGHGGLARLLSSAAAIRRTRDRYPVIEPVTLVDRETARAKRRVPAKSGPEAPICQSLRGSRVLRPTSRCRGRTGGLPIACMLGRT